MSALLAVVLASLSWGCAIWALATGGPVAELVTPLAVITSAFCLITIEESR